MLIVCNDALVGAMTPFVEWKSMRGLDVELITTSSVGGTTTGIKNAIQQRYDSAAGLAFVILVGDGQQLPSYSGQYEGANDDTRYVYLEGNDLYPDALISRISAQTVTQAQIQVKKFVDYERYPQAGADWYHKATGIASNEGSPTDYVRCDWLRDGPAGLHLHRRRPDLPGPGRLDRRHRDGGQPGPQPGQLHRPRFAALPGPACTSATATSTP